jgi:hypothetical protein
MRGTRLSRCCQGLRGLHEGECAWPRAPRPAAPRPAAPSRLATRPHFQTTFGDIIQPTYSSLNGPPSPINQEVPDSHGRRK